MGGLASGLLGGGKQKSGGSTSVSTVQVPDWLDSRNQGLAKRATTLSNRGFQSYDQPRVADFNTDSNAAFDLTRNTVGQYGDLMNTASSSVYDLIGRAQGPTSSQIQQYMNPYLDNVLDTTKRNTITDYNNQQAQRDREAGMINAFGGSRVAIRQGMADRDLSQNLQDIDYQGRFDAFNNAQSQFNRGTDVLNSGIQQGLNTTQTGQAYNQADINSLLKQGELQRLQEQDRLDFNYQEFDREQAHDYENVNFLANILNPYTSAYAGGTTTGTPQQSNSGGSSTLGNIAGIASTAASILPLFGFSDERLKENIKEVGQLENGLPIYSYNFKGSPKTEIGLIAQEVEQVKPETVTENEDGLKMVNYEEAVKLRDGGPVDSNRASTARLAGVANISGPSFPGVPSIPVDPKTGMPDIDAEGLESLLKQFNDSEYSFTKGDGNALGRLFGNYGENNYGAAIGPTMTPDAGGFYGMGGGNSGSLMSFLGFAEGGAVSKYRKSLKDTAKNTDVLSIDPNTQSPAGVFSRKAINALARTPSLAISELLRPVEGVESVGENLHPGMIDTFLRPKAKIDAERQAWQESQAQRAKQEYQALKEKAKESTLKDDVAAKFGRGGSDETGQPSRNTRLSTADLPNAEGFDPSMIPAINASQLGMDDNGRVIPASARAPNPQYSLQGMLPNTGTSQLPPWISQQPQRTVEEPSSKGINIPLLLAGLTMMGTDGDSGDKLLAGLGAATRYAGDQSRSKAEAARQDAEQKRQEFKDYIDFIKAQAYIDVAYKNASKGDSLTPNQRETLKLKKRQLDLQQRKIEADIAEGKGLDNMNPFKGLNTSLVDEQLEELTKEQGYLRDVSRLD